MKSLTALIIALICHIIVFAHQHEEAWWHPFAFDMEYALQLNVDSVEAALDTMTNPDSIFFAKLDIANHYYVSGNYLLAESRLTELIQLLHLNALPVADIETALIGTQILNWERLLMRNVSGAVLSLIRFQELINEELHTKVLVDAAYFELKLRKRTGVGLMDLMEDVKRVYNAALRLGHYEPMGEMAGWLLEDQSISKDAFMQLYQKLPPRAKSRALLFFGFLEEPMPDKWWSYRELIRLGGSTNMFSTFRGHLELASRMLEAGLLDSVPYHLEKAENAAKLLGDLEVDHHLTKVQQQYYFLRGDSVQVALYSQQLQHLDSAIALPVKDLAILLSNQLTEQANQSRDAISRRNRLLYGLVGLVSGLLVFVLIQTYRFNKQRKQLRRANDDKAMLYGMIAHDLRSPLAALDSVIRQEGIPASAQASIHSYARKLQFLLDDMLKWTFDQRQQLKPQPSSFDLVELVEENHHLLAQVLAEKLIAVQWDIEEEVVMYADREMISTCVRNMLQNAVKHSAVGSQITIRCREEDGKAVLEIDNEGSLSQRGGRSLGLQLIQSFSRLNNCRFSLEEHEGRVVAQLTGPNQ